MSPEQSGSRLAQDWREAGWRPVSPSEVTVDYHGRAPHAEQVGERPGMVPVAAFWAKPAVELSVLRRRRLRLVGLVFLVPFYGFLLRNAVAGSARGPSAALFWFHGSVALVLTLCTVLVWSQRSLGLRRLRLIEMVLFGCVAAFFAWLHYEWFQNETIIQRSLAAYGALDRDLTLEQLAGASSAFRWSILIVMYGVLIPNT